MDRRWVTEWEGASCYWVGSVWGLGGGFMGGGVSCTQCLLIAACLCVWTQLCVESETHSGLCFQTLWWECAAASPSINIQCKQWRVCRAPPPPSSSSSVSHTNSQPSCVLPLTLKPVVGCVVTSSQAVFRHCWMSLWNTVILLSKGILKCSLWPLGALLLHHVYQHKQESRPLIPWHWEYAAALFFSVFFLYFTQGASETSAAL